MRRGGHRAAASLQHTITPVPMVLPRADPVSNSSQLSPSLSSRGIVHTSQTTARRLEARTCKQTHPAPAPLAAATPGAQRTSHPAQDQACAPALAAAGHAVYRATGTLFVVLHLPLPALLLRPVMICARQQPVAGCGGAPSSRQQKPVMSRHAHIYTGQCGAVHGMARHSMGLSYLIRAASGSVGSGATSSPPAVVVPSASATYPC
jgi:hypothetical protein